MAESHRVEGMTSDGRMWRATAMSTTGASIWWRLEVSGVPLDRLMHTPGSVSGELVRAAVRELLGQYGISVEDRIV